MLSRLYRTPIDQTGHRNAALYSLSDLGLVNAPPDSAYDRITSLAQTVTGAPVAMLSAIEADKNRQFMTSVQGVPEPLASSREMPLEYSICAHVSESGAPLAIDDARYDLRAQRVQEFGRVAAYLGVPVRGPVDDVICVLSVIDHTPRSWTEDDLAAMEQLAGLAGREILLRASMRTLGLLQRASRGVA
ncbi:GAF domain-containing protein [Halovulum sp. GXIMD14794]